MRPLLFVVDDHVGSAEALSEVLEDEGYEVQTFPGGASALATLETQRPSVVLTDLRMAPMDGLALLRAVRERDSGLPVIIMTAYASIDRAIEATRAGAFAFATKPIKLPELVIQVRNACALRELQAQVDGAREESKIIGRSPALLGALSRADRAAATQMTVLIRGESGTGKELVAARIHRRSPRASMPFVAVNCGAIPEGLIEAELFGTAKGAFTGAGAARIGLIESADGGTLFLDEVGELSPDAQTRLLRFLQEGIIRRVGDTRDRSVDIRVIAASHRDLDPQSFREDLYYRLNVIPIELPPLRLRGDDILLLFGRALRRTCESLNRAIPGLTPEVISALMAHHWPGNVRELMNIADRIAVLSTGETLTLQDLPREIKDGARKPGAMALPEGNFDLTAWLERLEEQALRRALAHHGGVKARAAASLGLERNAFRYKLKKYGIEE